MHPFNRLGLGILIWDVIMAVLNIPNQHIVIGILFWISVIFGVLLLWAEPIKHETVDETQAALARLGVTTTEVQD
jgi:membrane-bound ClpP family serine protease